MPTEPLPGWCLMHCPARDCRHDHFWLEPDLGFEVHCPGHNDQGGTEHSNTGRVHVFCSCGQIVDSFWDNG